MHKESYNAMAEFAKKYVIPGMSVLDVGGADINGSYRTIFNNCKYQSLDFENADIIIQHGHPWPVPYEGYDAVISGQTLEHDPIFWDTLIKMKCALSQGGHMCIIVPSCGEIHKYPVDCYRFLEDCMRGFADWMGIDLIESRQLKSRWRDIVGVFKK